MAETIPSPEVSPPIQQATERGKTPEHTITPSLVEKIDFSEAELGLINTHLKFLEGKVKDNLKDTEVKLTLTQEKLTELRTQLEEAGKGKEKELTKEKVESIIDVGDFEKDTTSPKTPADALKNEATEYVTGALTAVVGVQTADAIIKDIQVGGFMSSIKKFFYEFSNFFSFLTGKKNTMSFETHEIYTTCIEKQLQDAGILPTTAADGEPVKTDIAAGSQFMGKIAAMGIPLEYADLYLPFITNPDSDITKIPSKVQNIFRAGKDHYTSLKQTSDNTDPTNLIDSIFDFEVPEGPVAPTGPAPAPAEAAPVHPIIEPIKFKDGDKEVALDAALESVTSFRKIQKTAETILGKETLKVEDLLKTTYAANAETDPKKKSEAVLKSVAIEITKKVREATAILGVKIEKITKDGKEISIADDSFTGDLLPAIDTKLQAYIPLAFKDLSKRVFDNVNETFKTPTPLPAGLTTEDYKTTRESILTTVIGGYTEPNQVNANKFTERTKNGHEEVFRDIIKQAGKLNDIKKDDFNKTLFTSYQSKSPLELS